MQLSVVLIEKYLQLADHSQILKHLHKIKNAITGLNGILNDFLSLEKLEAGIVTPDYQEFDIIKFSEELVEEMQLITKDNQIVIYQHTESRKYCKSGSEFIKELSYEPHQQCDQILRRRYAY